jgi:hypothetical protein
MKLAHNLHKIRKFILSSLPSQPPNKNNEQAGSNKNESNLNSRGTLLNLGFEPCYPGSPIYRQPNASTVFQTRHDSFLPNPFYFIPNQLFYPRPTVTVRFADSVVK